jgi:hypothetical protein
LTEEAEQEHAELPETPEGVEASGIKSPLFKIRTYKKVRVPAVSPWLIIGTEVIRTVVTGMTDCTLWPDVK